MSDSTSMPKPTPFAIGAHRHNCNGLVRENWPIEVSM